MGFGSNLFFYPGKGDGTILPPGSTIPSTDLPAGRQLVLDGMVDRPKRRDEMATLMESLPPMLGQVESLVDNLDRFLVRLDRRLMGPDDGTDAGLLATVDETTGQFGDLAAQLNTISVRLMPLLESLTALAQNLEDPEGLVPTLLGDEGTAARLFRDEGELYQNLLDTMTELHELMVFLRESTPEISVLMDETTGVMIESEQVLQGLKNNPLLRGGIPPRTDHSGSFGGYRKEGN
jgi:phospholipid/cholesterol/gamma-HCH transport system substrate-binding protein